MIKKISVGIGIAVIILTVLYLVGVAASHSMKYIANGEIEQYENRLAKLESNYEACDKRVKKLTTDFIKYQFAPMSNTIKVTLTAYHPGQGGINSDASNDYKNTATMSSPVPGYTVAISRDLLEAGWMGQKIFIYGYGVFEANDLLAKSIKGPQIDMCVGDLKFAYTVGRKEGIIAVRLMPEE